MADKIALFIGPSMPPGMKTGDNITIFNPIRSGDIYRIMTHGYSKLGIIDGVFHGVPSIWHREIRYAIDNGIDVYGSSSMGALRAAEMNGLGLIGIGQVYEWYQLGMITGDDEVALTHAPDFPYKASTIPLVDIRSILVNQMNISLEATVHHQIIELCRSIPYWHRTFQVLKQVFRERSDMPEIVNSVLQHIQCVSSIKKSDAMLLINIIQQQPCSQSKAHKLEKDKMPSVQIDLYSDFAMQLREGVQCKTGASNIDISSESNYKRSSFIHSFLAYWIEDKDPFGLSAEASEKAGIHLKHNISDERLVHGHGILIKELHHFVFLSHYFYLILDQGKVRVDEEIVRSSQIYLDSNPATDSILPSFMRFENLQYEHRIEDILAHEICIAVHAFDEYKLDLNNLLLIYASMFQSTKINDLEPCLQKYILIGTFGIRVLGCLEAMLLSHVNKYHRITQFSNVQK